MIVYPAIDIRNGRCVRLSQGRDDAQTSYYENPIEPAVQFTQEGAEWIHVVDLDGAFGGVPRNLESLKKISALGPKIQFGGGMRDAKLVDAALNAGASRVVIGTRAATDAQFLKEIAKSHGKKLAIGIDAKDGFVAVKGWTDVTQLKATDFAVTVSDLGISTVIYTDIATDGMLTGPNWKSLEALLKRCACGVIASGGVASSEDVAKLAQLSKAYPNLVGVIVGKALYEGRTNVTELLKVSRV
jgi:phosphoribosylformimino-5-aminoimidazole carboxamide ribotide isomerase